MKVTKEIRDKWKVRSINRLEKELKFFEKKILDLQKWCKSLSAVIEKKKKEIY